MRKMEPLRSPDALGEVFKLLQLDQTTYYHAEFFAPWAFKMTAIPKFHFVTSGRCWLKIDGEESFPLEAGDFVILPRGKVHRIASDPSARLVNIDSVPCQKFSGRLSAFKYGARGARTTLICGDLNFTHPAGSHLISYLPKVMHVKAIANRSMEWIHTTARFMLVEEKNFQPGGETIVTRLADILVILAIRSWIEQHPQELTGWLTGLQDNRISSAIAFIHQSPEKDWTLDSLAEVAAMSRSAFSARFSKLVGEPAMKYVTRWRMHLASIYLRDGNRTIDDIAALLGYGSGPAFSRAIRRIYGKWPGDLRASMKSGKP
jgi:AraC-like DNA-binding protein